MAGFSHPISDGNGQMVIDNLHSEDYAPAGVDGWFIGKDGTAEFGNLLLRNGFAVGRAPDGRIEIGATGPSNMIQLHVETPNPDGIDGPALLWVQDDVLFLQTLSRGADSALVRFVTPPNSTDPGSFEILQAGLKCDVMRPVWLFDSTSIAGIVSAVPTLGAPVCGISFIAPPSGVITYAIDTDFEVTTAAAGGYLIAFGELRTGSTVGAGTLVSSGNVAPFGPRRLIGAVVARDQGGTAPFPVSGLTPGAAYNVAVKHYQTAGTGRINSRGVIVTPHP
jgi:hypothetical protein